MKFTTRNIKFARIMYIYVFFSLAFALVFSILSIFTPIPFYVAFIPIFLFAMYFVGVFLKKNIRVVMILIASERRGGLIYYLTKATNLTYVQKIKLAKWIYPSSREIRNEDYLKLSEKASKGIALDKQERKEYAKRIVVCPQQALDGFNKAILINTCIYAHRNIHVLDESLRNILGLTDERMDSFDIDIEIKKCEKKQ